MIYFYFVIIELKNDFIGKNAEKEDIGQLKKYKIIKSQYERV